MSDKRVRESPEQRSGASVLVLDLSAEAAAIRTEGPSRHGHRQKTLFKGATRTVALFVVDVGAELPEHKAAGFVTIQPIEGEVVVTASGRSHARGPHCLLVLAPDVPHSVKAANPASFLLQVSLMAS
jgi:quercetin dioxygenase-like cupin family protein